MYGLVLGIRVAPRGPAVAETRAPRPIRLLVREQDRVYGEHAGFAYVLGGSKEKPTGPPCRPRRARPWCWNGARR